MSNIIKDIIENNDSKTLSLIPKTDFHLHANRACRINDFIKTFGLEHIETKFVKFLSLDDMETWVDTNIHPHIKGREDWEKRLSLMFLSQKEDAIKIFEPSFTIKDVLQYQTVSDFIDRIERMKSEIYPDSDLRPTLSFSKRNNPCKIQYYVEEYLETGWFQSIDLCNDEKSGRFEDFEEIYKIANKLGLIKKAHVGEYGTATDVVNAIDILMLDEVQHGISIIEDMQALKYAVERDVLFNVCPASNIAMNLCPSYSEHPIKKMYHAGLKITICTDDLLVFNKSVSEQIIELHQQGVFSASELSKILEEGFIRRKTNGKNSRYYSG